MEIITRADATARGLKRFFTGVPCKNGHTSERYVSSTGGCVTCSTRKGRNRIRARPALKSLPTNAASAAEAAPPAAEARPVFHRDPGTRVSQARIDAVIERIFNDYGLRLGAPALRENEAA
jgi:hypothetical protein